jgi:ABC-type taurine transport system ATPase subunit
MTESMQVVAQQLFLGKGTEKSPGIFPVTRKLLGEVADRVLTGYTTEKVVLAPGKTTVVTFTIVPWSNVIHNPIIDLQFSGVSPTSWRRTCRRRCPV